MPVHERAHNNNTKNIQKPILLFQAHLHEIILILCAVYFWAMLMVVQ